MYIAYDHDSESHKYIHVHMYVQYTWIAPITCRPTNFSHNNEIILTNVAQYNLTLQIRFFLFSFSGTCTSFNHRFKINTLYSLSTNLHVLSFSLFFVIWRRLKMNLSTILTVYRIHKATSLSSSFCWSPFLHNFCHIDIWHVRRQSSRFVL